MPLYGRDLDDQEIDSICAGCKLVDTKPGTQPANLTHWINVALDLRDLKEAGATFSYPETFSSREWIALKSLTVANESSQRKERRQKTQDHEKEAKRKAEEERLRGLIAQLSQGRK